MPITWPRIALPLLALMMSAASASAQWEQEQQLSTGGGSIYGQALAATGNTVHMVFGNTDIRYRRSVDQGGTWSNVVPLGGGSLHLTDPMAADGNDVWVVYLDNITVFSDWCCARDSGNLWLRRSRDGGTTWDAPVQLSTSQSAFRYSLAYAAGRLHLVWMDYRTGAWDTYYLRSPDRGDNWDAERVLASSMGVFGAERPQVAARGDSVHVTIWDDREPNPPCTPGTVTFAQCPDTVHMRSTNGGLTWGPITNVANGGAYFSGRNDIAVAGSGNVVINFNVDVAGEVGSKLFAVTSTDDGATWGTPVRLTFSANASDHGSIIGGGNDVHLVWHDDRNPANREVYYRRSRNAGVTWDPEEQVSPNLAGDSSTPLNAVTADYVHVIYIDDRGSGYQVRYRRRPLVAQPPTDGGVPDAGGMPATGPVAWWRLDETTGAVAADSSGNGHNGTLVGTPVWSAGRNGGGLNLAGTQGHVGVPAFPLTGSLTLEAWVNALANAGQDSIILNKSNGEYDLRISGTGFLTALAGQTSLTDATFNFYDAQNAGTWHHVAYTFDDVNQVHSLFIDGTMTASGTNASSIGSSGNDLWLGRHSQFDFGTFQGTLDDVQLFNRVLTEPEKFAEAGGVDAGPGPSSSSSSSSSGSTSGSMSSSSSSSTGGASGAVSSSSSTGGSSSSSAQSGSSGSSSLASSSSAASSGSGGASSSGAASTAGGSSGTSGASTGGGSGAASGASGGSGSNEEGGCSCNGAPGASPAAGALAALWAAAVVRLRRRRQR